jgi:chemotaxis protein MotB
MVSYLDVLTILLILFVAGAAHAIQPEPLRPPPPPPAVSPAPAPGPPAKPAIEAPAEPPEAPTEPPEKASQPPAAQALDEALQSLAAQGFDLHREPWGVVVTLPQTILFSPGDERIPAAALPVVKQLAALLKTVPNRVNLAGNADSVPIHNRRFRNNWELSAARGMALLDLLAGTYGIEESRLSVTSYGSVRPRASNDSPQSRAGNRRVEITVLEEAKEQVKE